MKFRHILFVLLLSVVVSFATVTYMSKQASIGIQNKPKETAYERVMRTGTLRCAYFLYPDVFEKDLKTGAYSGMYYEIVEEMGKRLSLKIDWAEEAGFSNIFDGLKTNRYDAVCVPLTPTPGRARVAEFTAPIIFAPSYAYVRANDARFDNSYEKINDPSVRIAFLEGEMAQTIRAEDFPKTQAVSLPNMSDLSQVMLQVVTGKADIVITEPSTAEVFLSKNPEKLKRVIGPPIRVSSAGLAVGVGETEFKSLLNSTIESLLLTGFIKRVVDRYTAIPDQIFFPAQQWGASSVPLKGKTPQ